MQFTFRTSMWLLVGCLLGAPAAAMAVQPVQEADGSFSYFLSGNVLALSSPGDLVLGGHDAGNHGINLIDFQNGQFRIGGFLGLNDVDATNYLTDYGDALSVSTSLNPGYTIYTISLSAVGVVDFRSGFAMVGSQPIVVGQPSGSGAAGSQCLLMWGCAAVLDFGSGGVVQLAPGGDINLTSGSGTISITPSVPEPSTWLAMLAGLALLASVRPGKLQDRIGHA